MRTKWVVLGVKSDLFLRDSAGYGSIEQDLQNPRVLMREEGNSRTAR